MEKVWLESWNELSGASLYVARASSWIKIENGIATNVPELENDHEEADSKIAFMIKHATRENSECTVGLVRSSSGDIIIPVILVAGEFDTRILIDNVTGKYRKISDVSACKLSGKQKKHCLGCTPLLAMTMFRAFFQRKATLLEARQREFSSSWLIRYFRKWSMYNFWPAGWIGTFCVYDFWKKAERSKERNI